MKNLTDALNAHAIVSIADSSGKITYVNEKFCTISGYSAEELLGKPHSIVKSDVHPKEFYTTLWQTIRSGKVWQGQVCNRRKDGRVYWVQSTITPIEENKEENTEENIKEGTNTPYYYISIRTDITNLIYEQEARRAAEIAAEKANRAKSIFLSNMSHELRTPLNSILGFAQILENSKKYPLGEKQKSHVQQISRSGGHLLSLINEVLDLAQVESGKITLSIESIRVDNLIEDCCSLIKVQAQIQNITIVPPADIDKNLFVKADYLRLKQVLLNLVSNAIKYNQPNGTVTVSVSAGKQKCIRFTVKDTGFGIPLEKQSGIFKPFNRLGAENSEIEGTGIGLTITRTLTTLMGGTIGFSSQQGEGSVFWVEFPVALPPSHQPSSSISQASQASKTMAEHKTTRRILYIEDNPSNVRFLESVFEDVDWINIQAISNAELGLPVIINNPPDLILMDINLSGKDGIDSIIYLKQNPQTAKIPILVLSADATKATISRALNAGCLDYLTKPVDINRLMAAIDLALKENPHD